MKNILDPSSELMFLMYCGNMEDRSEFPSQVELLEAWRQRTPNAEKLLNDFEFTLKRRSLFGKDLLIWMLPYANDNFFKKSLEYSLLLFSGEDINFKSPKNI